MEDNRLVKQILDQYKYVSLKDKLYLKARYKLCHYFQSLNNLIPASGTILDWGCGLGFFSLYMKLSRLDRKIIGVEIDKRKLGIVKKISRQFNDFNVKYIDEVNFSPKEFDAVVLLEVSYYLSTQSYIELLTTFRTILKDNGSLVILNTFRKEKDWKYYFVLLQEFISTRIIKQTMCEGLFIRSESEENDIYDQCNFRVEVSKKIHNRLPYMQIINVLKK